MIHDRGNRAWGRIEILHLLRHDSVAFDFQRQLNRIIEITAGMAGNQIGNEELLESKLFIGLLVFCLESAIDFRRRFSHHLQGFAADMLRCYLELATDMILTEFSHKVMLLVHHQIVKADS